MKEKKEEMRKEGKEGRKERKEGRKGKEDKKKEREGWMEKAFLFSSRIYDSLCPVNHVSNNIYQFLN